MDFSDDPPSAIFSRIPSIPIPATGRRWGLLKPASQSTRASGRYRLSPSPNVLIKLDRIPKALLGVLHATGDAGVTGQVECDHEAWGACAPAEWPQPSQRPRSA